MTKSPKEYCLGMIYVVQTVEGWEPAVCTTVFSEGDAHLVLLGYGSYLNGPGDYFRVEPGDEDVCCIGVGDWEPFR